jgi:hypothetical protein
VLKNVIVLRDTLAYHARNAITVTDESTTHYSKANVEDVTAMDMLKLAIPILECAG